MRGACRRSGNFANFSRDFCAKFASSRRWTRALSCIRTHADSAKSCNEVLWLAQPRWPISRNFCARGAPKIFGNFAILSRELGTNLRDPDARRLLFSDLDAMLTRSTLSDVVQYAQRTLADCAQFFCARGAPDFRKLCKLYAQLLRKICVMSTLDSRVIFH